MLAGPLLADAFARADKPAFDAAFDALLDRVPGMRFKVEARMPAQVWLA